MVTFSSDVDSQAPWYGRFMHQQINERLGLPISDSVHVTSAAGVPLESALFKSHSEINDQPSLVDDHTVAGLLLREWHRGNIDQLHSWYSDYLPQFRFVIPEPAAPTAEGAEISLPPAQWMHGYFASPNRGYQQLRLYFDKEPPVDLEVILRFKSGVIVTAEPRLVRRGRMVQAQSSPDGPFIVNLILNAPPDVGISLGGPILPGADDKDLMALTLKAPSCASGCAAKLLKLERDNYGRLTVLDQMPWLETWNVRSLVYTSHGGNTVYQSFGAGPYPITAPEVPGKEHIRQIGQFEANNPFGPAYIADLLRTRLGVRAISSLDSSTKFRESYYWWETPPPLLSNFEGFYALSRTYAGAGLVRDFSALQDVLGKGNLSLRDVDAERHFCLTHYVCSEASQGPTAGFDLAVSRALIEAGRPVEHLWYQHLGVMRMDPDYPISQMEPIKPAIRKELEALASRYWNITGDVPEQQRTWVPAVSTWQLFRIARETIGDHLVLKPETSEVHIEPWTDPVTGKRVPEADAGTRDLHGVTIYVPNAASASVFIGNREVTTLTRNAPDGTGRPSVTIVDNNTPTIILDELSPETLGSASVERGRWSWETGDAAYGQRFGRLAADGGQARLVIRPADLAFWNPSHLHFAMRKTGFSRLMIEIRFANGCVIRALENGASSEGRASATMTFSANPGLDPSKWSYVTLSLADMHWAPGISKVNETAFPVGKVEAVTIDLTDSAPNAVLDIDGLEMLRPSTNGEAKDGAKSLSGRVMSNAVPAAAVEVEMAMADGSVRKTTTTQHGYFYFSDVPRGAIVEVRALLNNRWCRPARGTQIEVRRNEFEIDIDPQYCR
jgi:hypothetical protein